MDFFPSLVYTRNHFFLFGLLQICQYKLFTLKQAQLYPHISLYRFHLLLTFPSFTFYIYISSSLFFNIRMVPYVLHLLYKSVCQVKKKEKGETFENTSKSFCLCFL